MPEQTIHTIRTPLGFALVALPYIEYRSPYPSITPEQWINGSGPGATPSQKITPANPINPPAGHIPAKQGYHINQSDKDF